MMYRIENYITSIILSKVDRYIKNFRREDVKVSLWKGDCVLYNLDLDLDVLEQELNLPFSFTSGHIHQLQIHVPWTRLNSESVQVTINTIECVMKLKSQCRRHTPPTPPANKQLGTEENMAPSSYLTSLVNKILCNLSVTCNNLILKYVEEDIVLSMNIKTLSLTTVNSKWQSEYSELTTTDLILRKLISLVDVTLCLDKRNASGRIESYLKPLLYKCSMVLRLSRSYPSVNSSNSSSTRIALHCDNFNLSISEPQVSMLLRLYFLTRMAVNQSREASCTSIHNLHSNNPDLAGEEESEMGWGSWLWGFVPTISPLISDTQDLTDLTPPINKFHLGLYVDLCTLDMKLSKAEEASDWESILQVVLGGCFLELTSNGSDWSNIQVGVCSANLSPVPNTKQETYLECGEVPKSFFTSSLFANPDMDLTQRPWEYHLSTVTETLMMERAPTFYMDFISIIEKDHCSDLDEPVKEIREKQLVRYVVGPVCISIGSQLVDKLTVLKQSLYSYDYSPYTQLSNTGVSVLSQQDVELFKATVDTDSGYFVPQYTSQFTFFGARIKIYPADSSYLQQGVTSKGGPPYILLKIKCLDGKITRPVLPEKLAALASQFGVPDICLNTAQTTISLLLVEARVGVVIRDMEGPDAFEISNLSWSATLNNVFKDNVRDDVFKQSSLLIERVLLFSSKPKLILGWEILFSLLTTTKKSDLLYNTSLLRDCRSTNESIYVEVKVCDCECKYLLKRYSECASLSIGSVSGSTVLTREALRETVLASVSPHNDNLLEILVQRPVGGEWRVAPLLSFKLSGLNICLGRNLCLYVMYSPQTNHIRAFNIMQTSGSARKISTSSLSSLHRKHMLDQRKTPSDSDILPASIVNYLSTAKEESFRLMSVVISGDVSGCTLVFPSPTSSNSSSALVFTLGSLSVRSPLGRINYDLKQLPVHVDNWNQDKMNFPWSIFICEAEGYAERSGFPKLPLLHKVSSTVTLAVTTKQDPELNRVSTIALCLHIDTTPISVALSYQQVVLVSEVSASLYQVYHALVPPAVPSDPPCLPPPLSATPPPPDPANTKTSDDSTSNSLSNRTPVGSVEEFENDGRVKVTLWLQCTVTKCTIALYSLPSKYSDQHLKYVLDIDDIFMTLDVVSVYQKMKLKVATAQAKHYTRLSGNIPWRAGCFSGIIMKGNETKSDNKDSDDFLSVTLTRASAANLHRRLNHNTKTSGKEFESGYISEVVVKIQPLDFVLSPLVVGKVLHIVEPLLDQQDLFPLGRNYSTSPIYGQSVFNFTTSNLPLLYLDITVIRLFVPTASSTPAISSSFDTIYLQVEKVSLSSEAVNPVSRKFVRSELYERHGSRLTTVPGSRLEDRQYQLDCNVSISTGKWCEVVKAIEEEEGVVGQNPAVYWNSAQDHQALHHKTAPLLNSLALTVIVAPPITTAGFIITGLNVEVNIISEIDLTVDIEQVKLLTQVYSETVRSFPGFHMGDMCSSNNRLDREFTLDLAPSDSGVESVDESFQTARREMIEIPVNSIGVKSSSAISQISISTPTSINTRRYHQRTQTVPIDVLITTKALIVKLYRTSGEEAEPLFFLLLSQPYIALEKQADISIFKGSLYEIEMKHGSCGHLVDKHEISQESYPVALVQNKSGDSDPDKGIPPALFNFISTTQGIRSPTVDVEFGRPIKFLFKTSSIDYLYDLKNLLLLTFDLPDSLIIPRDPPLKKSSCCNISKKSPIEEKSSMNSLKNYFHSCSIFLVNTKQIVLDFQILEPEIKGCLLSVGGVSLTGEWSEAGCLSTRGQISAVCLSACNPEPRLVAGPWTVSGCIARDPKIPSISATVDAGVLTADLSKDAVETLTAVTKEFKPYLISSEQKQNYPTEMEVDEHYYRDDLQAGAFQFVTSGPTTTNRNALPLPYQVIFPSKKIMAWTYPAPRAITGVTLLPLPSEDPETELESVRVSIEYFECGVWRHWLEVKGSSSGCSVEGIIPPGVCVAATWRAFIRSHPSPHVSVLATALRINSIYSPTMVPFLNLRLDLHSLQVSVWTKQYSVVSLPGSLSRYSPDSSLPSSYPVCTLFLEPIQAFYTYWQSGDMVMEVDLRPRLDVLNPRTLLQQCCLQPFSLNVKSSFNSTTETRHSSASSTIESVNDFRHSPANTSRRSNSGRTSLDHGSEYWNSSGTKQWQVAVKSSPIVMRLAPPLCHTLLAATKGAVLTPYIVCNDSAAPIRFGQMGTVEDVVLDPLCCNFYSWRSAKQQTLLRFSLSRHVKSKNTSESSPINPEGAWTEGICLDEERIFRIELEDESNRIVILLVTVKHLSPILTQVVVGGQLLMFNMLDSPGVECRVVSSSISEVQRRLTLQPSTRAPALTLSPNSKYSLRLSTVPNRWSGLVPLMSNNNVWMVKIPLEDKDQYVSAWCQIVQEEGSLEYPRLMVILSPIYLLRSYLPCESSVVITTEGFPGQISQTVPGRGSTSNLQALGTATHTHSLDFAIEGVETEGGGGISLSYGLVEGRGPAPGPVPPLPRLLELADIQSHLVTDWPPISSLTGIGLSPASWAKAQQPNTLTHVKVKFGCDLLKVTNSLMVELQPWALLVNTTGFHVYLMKNNVTLASLPHFSVVAPPQLLGSFKLGVDLESSGVQLSSDIELSQNQVFYMPQISGIVPLNGQLNINIPASDKVICVTLQSSLSNGMRLLHACSTFSIINLSSYDLNVAPLLVFRERNKLILPRVLENYAVPLPSQSITKPIGVGLPKWYKIDEGSRNEGKHYLLFEKDYFISSPVHINLTRERQVHTVLLPISTCSQRPSTSERPLTPCSSSSDNSPQADVAKSQGGESCRSRECCPPANIALTVVIQTTNGQTYITVDDQPTPQLVIHNESGVNLTVTKASPTRGGAGLPLDDFPDWEWRLTVPNNRQAYYFFGHQDASKPLALVLSRPQNNSWSNSISVVGSTSGRLVTVPQCHDLTASVTRRGSTIHVKLTPANQRIVAASDIRSRLLNMNTPAVPQVRESLAPLLLKEEQEQVEEAAVEPCQFDCYDANGNPSETGSTMLDSSASEKAVEDSSHITVKAELKNITMVLCSEAPNGYQWVDVASLSMDNVTITSYPYLQKEDEVVERCIDVKVSELQLDNEEYQRGGYDFGVVLLCKSDMENSQSALHLKLNFDYQSTPALQDIVLNMCPMQAFIEDVYVTRLKEQMAKMLPEVSVVCTEESSSPVQSEEKTKDEETSSSAPVRRKTETEGSIDGNPKEDDDELFNVSDSEAEQENKTIEKISLPKSTKELSRKTSMLTHPQVDQQVDSLPFPEDVLFTALELSRPLRLRTFSISAVCVTVSVHTSTRFYIALDNSPLHFASFERKDMLTTTYRLGHALSLHYFLGAIYGTGWAIGSVELLGAPAGLARSVGTGLKSFVTLPCRGAVNQGPTGFFTGFLHGSASLMKHLTAGTVMSVTKLAGSWSRTLDRLTLQDEDLKYAEEMRRVRPEGLTQALKLGLTELGVNILGGVGGLAQKPMEYVASGNQSLASTLGLALVGVITRPLSGAAELLALTGQGILAGAGWTHNHLPKHESGGRMSQLYSESRLRYSWKYLSSDEVLLAAVDSSCCLTARSDEKPCIALLTTQRLCLVDSRDNMARSFDLNSVQPIADSLDPLRINFLSVLDGNDNVEMYSKRRIEEFIRESGRALRKSPSTSYASDTSDRSIERLPSETAVLHLFVPTPSTRVYFLSLLSLAKRHRSSLGFDIISG